MPATDGVIVPVRRISPERGHFFFGYYDVSAADCAGRHLCHQVEFWDRLPGPADKAVLGWLPMPDSAIEPSPEPMFTPFAETNAWNFQQGAMLQWLPARPDICIYNVFDGGAFGACLHNVRTGAQRRLPMPVASVSADGRRALCINMARLYAFRPGYGYEEAPDPFADLDAPAEDGVFLMDLDSGSVRLVLSLAEIVEFLGQLGEDVTGRKICVNHITFNPSATRYLVLVRTMPQRTGERWTTFLLTADSTGGGLRHHQVWGLASHYNWRDDDNILIVARTSASFEAGSELVLISHSTGQRELIDPTFFSTGRTLLVLAKQALALVRQLPRAGRVRLHAVPASLRFVRSKRHNAWPIQVRTVRRAARGLALRFAPALDAGRHVGFFRLNSRRIPRAVPR